MASISETHYFHSTMLDSSNITKYYVANEDEIRDIITFETKLRERLDSLRPEDVIRYDYSMAMFELNKARKHSRKYYYYLKAAQKAEDELREIAILRKLITTQKNIDIIYLFYYIQLLGNKLNIVKAYIKTGKRIDVSSNFYNCFDEQGNILEDKIVELDNLLKKFVKNLDVKGDKNEIFRNIARLFYTKKQYEDAVIQKQRKEQQSKEEYEAKEEIKRKQYQEEEEKRRQEALIKQAKVSQFLDIKGRLKPYAINYPLEIVLESIRKEKGDIDLSPYEIQYYNLLTIKEINSLLTIKCDKEEREKLLSIIEDNDLLKKARDIILSEDYTSLDDINQKQSLLLEELLEEEKEEELINTISESKAIFLFPFVGFFQAELAQNTSKINVAYEQIINQVKTKFLSLRNNSLIEMRSKNNALVHRILNNSNDGFKLCGDLEAYRFGHRINKLCYVSIPMPDVNRQMLKERYALSDDFKVYAILGFGNVRLENEELFYERIIRNAKKMENYYQTIYELFSKPFTEATFDLACDYIDSGSKQMEELLGIEYIKINKGKRNT